MGSPPIAHRFFYKKQENIYIYISWPAKLAELFIKNYYLFFFFLFIIKRRRGIYFIYNLFSKL